MLYPHNSSGFLFFFLLWTRAFGVQRSQAVLPCQCAEVGRRFLSSASHWMHVNRQEKSSFKGFKAKDELKKNKKGLFQWQWESGIRDEKNCVQLKEWKMSQIQFLFSCFFCTSIFNCTILGRGYLGINTHVSSTAFDPFTWQAYYLVSK